MRIVGTSGASILLAGQIMMRHRPVIHLKESELVNHHSAVLRFNSLSISKFLNIPFKEVTIDKCIYYNGNRITTPDLGLQNMYSQKVTGIVTGRSINNMKSEIRYIAPDNLFELMTYGLDIKYNCDLMDSLFNNPTHEPVLSYVKMPTILDHLKLDKPEFQFRPVYTVNAKIVSPEVQVYQTIYYPGDEDYYRVSITGNSLIIEYINEPKGSLEILADIKNILSDFSIRDTEISDVKVNTLPVGKMVAIDDTYRRSVIDTLSTRYNIYSFGRNGIWKSIRLDELFEDIHKIDKMLSYKTRQL